MHGISFIGLMVLGAYLIALAIDRALPMPPHRKTRTH